MSTKLPKKFKTKGAPEMGFEVMPNGRYRLKVVGCEVKETKAKIAAKKEGKKLKGRIWNFNYQVQEGDCKGQKVFVGMNLENEKAEAEEIAWKELTSLNNACGFEEIEDAEQVIGCEFEADVAIKVSDNPQYPDQNVIKKYYPLSGKSSPKPEKKGKKGKDEKKEGKKKKKKKIDL